MHRPTSSEQVISNKFGQQQESKEVSTLKCSYPSEMSPDYFTHSCRCSRPHWTHLTPRITACSKGDWMVKLKWRKKNSKTFDSNQTILPLMVGFDSSMDAKSILCHFIVTIYIVRVWFENCFLSNGEDSLLDEIWDFAFVIWERGS